MRKLFVIYFLIISTVCDAQRLSEYDYPDLELDYQFNAGLTNCDQEKEMAKNFLSDKKLPVYNYCLDITGNLFRQELIKTCNKNGIYAKPKTCVSICGFGADIGAQGACFYDFLKKDLIKRKGEDITDKINKEAILATLDIEPDYMVQMSGYISSDETDFIYPQVYFEKWVPQSSNAYDTLFLDKQKYKIKKFYTDLKTSSSVREYPIGIHLDLIISRNGEMTLIMDDEDAKDLLDFSGLEKISAELVALTKKLVTEKYKKWKPATFYGRKVRSKVTLFVVFRN